MSQLGTIVLGGGSGFIGTALSNLLKSKGYNIVVVSRTPGPSRMTWSELQSGGLPKGTTAVVSLAGQNVLDPTRGWSPGFKQNVWASRVHTTKYLADAIKEADVKPKVFVSTSGVGFYPPSMTKEYDESSEGGDFDFLSKLCTDWENATQLPANLNVRTVIIRCGVVLGRNGGMIRQMFLPFYLGLGGPVGSGNQYLPWIHIHDVASLYLHAIETKDLTGVLNGVAPQLITNKEFAKSFGRALWRPSFIPLPTFVLNMMFSEERAKIMTEGQKVIPKKVIKSGFNYAYPDINSAAKEFAKLIY
ncbi:Epimerase family protein [Armadillidium nasatum]|uniref:Epimerase family protein n=1 Tax=Armadillidium nasatum TaxID=96803 RepID=A0A5N5TJ73_9CRUS|nr:Epimerase family protein [Armadillidium nasatum]